MFAHVQPHWLALRRFTAAFGVAVLLLLSVLAVRPDFHEKLHSDAAGANHECAVMLFSGGVPAPLPPTSVVAPVQLRAESLTVPVERLARTNEEQLQPPGRGPPARIS